MSHGSREGSKEEKGEKDKEEMEDKGKIVKRCKERKRMRISFCLV